MGRVSDAWFLAMTYEFLSTSSLKRPRDPWTPQSISDTFSLASKSSPERFSDNDNDECGVSSSTTSKSKRRRCCRSVSAVEDSSLHQGKTLGKPPGIVALLSLDAVNLAGKSVLASRIARGSYQFPSVDVDFEDDSVHHDSSPGDPAVPTSADRAFGRCCQSTFLEDDLVNQDTNTDFFPVLPSLPITLNLDTTSTARKGLPTDRAPFVYDDWKTLKKLYSRAMAQYENNAVAALPLFRGLVHECHRFLMSYEDPSVLYVNKHPRRPSLSWDPLNNPDENGCPDPQPTPKPEEAGVHDCKCPELPTTFHAILGTTLFLFGHLIAQDPTLALPGEPTLPSPYWLAAVDVFETGEALPSRTSGRCSEAREDWKMALVWGRTLVCLANFVLTRKNKAKNGGTPDRYTDAPDWSPGSPYSVIAARRPPSTRHLSLSRASTHDLMALAIDQFSRGIFHMPHEEQVKTSPSGVSAPTTCKTFSRPRELYAVASEVLGVAERHDIRAERQGWATWAESVLNQIELGGDFENWRTPITRARGRCWLIVGVEKAGDIEMASKKEPEILFSDAAQDARTALMMALTFFSCAKSSESMWQDPEPRKSQLLLTEAILTLASITVDEAKREELYIMARTGIYNAIVSEDPCERMDVSA